MEMLTLVGWCPPAFSTAMALEPKLNLQTAQYPCDHLRAPASSALSYRNPCRALSVSSHGHYRGACPGAKQAYRISLRRMNVDCHCPRSHHDCRCRYLLSAAIGRLSRYVGEKLSCWVCNRLYLLPHASVSAISPLGLKCFVDRKVGHYCVKCTRKQSSISNERHVECSVPTK